MPGAPSAGRGRRRRPRAAGRCKHARRVTKSTLVPRRSGMGIRAPGSQRPPPTLARAARGPPRPPPGRRGVAWPSWRGAAP
eukprot:3786165-Alexandrium_andersonii.AAC.1